MPETATDSILRVANDKDVSESGGGHNQKGVDFQRYWAVMRMFELEAESFPDFLFLFEAIQDVAVLDSPSSPTTITLYQVKKKDRKEWSWSELTGLTKPGKKAPPPTPVKEKVAESPIGKLYVAVRACKDLNSEGRFISNAGCDISLANGSNAATSLPCHLGQLATAHVELLERGLVLLADDGPTELSRLHLHKVALPPDSPDKQVVGTVLTFLESRSPRHAGQARALVEALMAKVAPLGRRTDTCSSFEELRKERGYERQQFVEALATLQEIPDVVTYLNEWIAQLIQEGVDVMTTTQMRVAATAFHRRRLLGAESQREAQLADECKAWVTSHPPGASLRPCLESGYETLKGNFGDFKKAEIFVHLALQGIEQCVDPTSGG